MGDVTLSAAVRSSLLSLQDTTDLIARTQDRLSTGLKVSSAIDDPVAFFQAKSLSDRASDFVQRKDSIDQGISTVTAALDAVDAIESLSQQLKGLAQSLKSSTGTQFSDLITQFNDLRSQIANLTSDATYQGTNLVNGTGQTLTVEFSEKTASLVTINSVDLTQSGLGIGAVATYSGGDSVVEVNYATAASVALTLSSSTTANSSLTASFTFTYKGPDETFTSTGSFQLSYGTQTLVISVQTGFSQALTQGASFVVGIVTAADLTANTGAGQFSAFYIVNSSISVSAGNTGATGVLTAGTIAAITTENVSSYISETDTDAVNAVISQLDSALTVLRTNAATLGSNVALLQTRFDFTEAYVNTLETGAAKLTLADINEEGANLLALQTRQQLGISALSFAGQAEQSILQLFR